MKIKGFASMNTTNSIAATIDTILAKGGNILYDKYIQEKIPNNVKANFETVIQTLFNPVVNQHQKGQNQIKQIHQSMIQKIKLVQNCNRNRQSKTKMQNYKKGQSNGSNQIKLKRKKDHSNVSNTKQKCHERKRYNSQKDREPNYYEKQCYKKIEQSQTETQEENIMWSEKNHRYNQQRGKQRQKRLNLQKSMKLRKQLEEQMKQLQQHNKTITFNHQTGRIIQLSQHHEFDNTNTKILKKNTLLLRYNFLDDEDEQQPQCPLHLKIKNTRKIMSFQRKRRQIKLIDENVDNSSYNNNGKRQTTTIPYMQFQQGVHLKQGFHNKAVENPKSTNRPRITSASETHRTFKSYTKQKIESARYARTIATAASGGRPNLFLMADSLKDQRKMTSAHSGKSSILWSSKKLFKDHKINKNLQLMQNMFDMSQEVII